MSFWKHLVAILALPVSVTIAIPIAIILSTHDLNVGWSLPEPITFLPLVIGGVLIGTGLILMIKTISLFTTVGQGTLAPWAATKKLVVQGIYRYVRNPMISGVFCISLGEALFFGSSTLLMWTIVVALINSIYMPLIEEPGLERRFGAEYRLYKKNVPRWIPRRKPWPDME
ncbi:MAG TPA: isoprenylcysteine carboxylmethyltransferase family protein [Anaerolineae bacterium]|nr:isoprenylcysteine carboxylmethyltransferase family protein [Anaerolineae bacterium]